MTVNPLLVIAVVAGSAVGLGVFLVIRELMPATPALGPALNRLHPAGVIRLQSTSRRLDWLTGLSRWTRPPTKELALLGKTPEQYTLSLLLSALIGLAIPAMLSLAAATVGVSLPFVIPTAAGLGLAAVFAAVAHADVLSKAKKARREFTQAICTYLDLVALQLSAAHGPVQSLERAAEVCDGWVFERLRESLRMAQMQMQSPWDELRMLADKIGVPELGDVGAIVQASGTEGAQVHETLRVRADSLRDQIRTDNLARAEAITSRLDVPGALLVFVLVGFVLYPFLARI